MNVKLLTQQHLKFLSLKGGCTGLSESTPVKLPNCWKSYGVAHISKKTIQIRTHRNADMLSTSTKQSDAQPLVELEKQFECLTVEISRR